MAGKSEKPTKTKKPAKPNPEKPVLLSGGNPQIPKGYGEEPVQAYIAAMPGWKQDVGRRLDEIISRTVPACAKPSNGTRPFTASRITFGSSVFIASRGT